MVPKRKRTPIASASTNVSYMTVELPYTVMNANLRAEARQPGNEATTFEERVVLNDDPLKHVQNLHSSGHKSQSPDLQAQSPSNYCCR